MDELNPEWLNNDFFSDCLQNESKNKNLTVTDFKVESAVPPGNNFGSIVGRVKVYYSDGPAQLSKSLIIKLPLTHGSIKELLGESLQVEHIFYKEYLPKAYKLLKNEYAPKYYLSSSTRPVVVLEDLKESGFVMADKVKKLNLDSCLHYAVAAAAFHGGSFAVFKNHPELNKRLCIEKLLSNETKMATSTKNMMRYGLECMAERVLKLTGDKRISNIIQASSGVMWDMMVELMKPTGEFNTMNQGDPWITNMMFKNDNDGNCVGMKVLDFQAMRYSSPATDLAFFLWSSAKHYVREDNYDLFIQTYLEAMNRNLEEMNCRERLSMDFLKKEFLRMGPIALYIASSGMPLLEIPEGVDMNGLFARLEQDYSPENNPLEVFYTEDFCQNHMLRLVNQIEKLITFEYLDQCVQKFK